MRLGPVPTEPTIVFAGANSLGRVKALQDARAEAIMTSFEYIKTGKYMGSIAPLFDQWPTRRYLDSGVFTFVRKAGTTRIRIQRVGKEEVKTPAAQLAEFIDFYKSYKVYLAQHKDVWDHIIELDVDEIAATVWYQTKEDKPTEPDKLEAWADRGKEWALTNVYRIQNELREIVGDKLMPAWHVQRGWDGWDEMVKKFPYVAIGSDTAVATSTASTRPPMRMSVLRDMVRTAHRAGCAVHYLGDTKFRTFLEAELDSADSTTWVSAGRFGQLPGPKGQSIRYTGKTRGEAWDPDEPVVLQSPANSRGLARQRDSWQYTARPIDMARARQFEDLMNSWGIDPNSILAGKQSERLLSTIKLLQRRQQEIRYARFGTEIPR